MGAVNVYEWRRVSVARAHKLGYSSTILPSEALLSVHLASPVSRSTMKMKDRNKLTKVNLMLLPQSLFHGFNQYVN